MAVPSRERAASHKQPTSQLTAAEDSSWAGSAATEGSGSRDPDADWLPASTGRGRRRLWSNRERKAAGVHFRSLWLAVLLRRLAPWLVLGFAVRDAGPEAEGGRGERGGRAARTAGVGWKSPAPRPAQTWVAAPCPVASARVLKM